MGWMSSICPAMDALGKIYQACHSPAAHRLPIIMQFLSGHTRMMAVRTNTGESNFVRTCSRKCRNQFRRKE